MNVVKQLTVPKRYKKEIRGVPALTLDKEETAYEKSLRPKIPTPRFVEKNSWAEIPGSTHVIKLVLLTLLFVDTNLSTAFHTLF